MIRSTAWLLLAALSLVAPSSNAQTTNSLILSRPASFGGAWQFNWPATGTDVAYTVQFQETPQDGLWRSPDSPVPFPLSSNSWADLSTTNRARFYRVLSVPSAQRGKLLSANLSNTLST